MMAKDGSHHRFLTIHFYMSQIQLKWSFSGQVMPKKSIRFYTNCIQQSTFPV